jgi:hypothetical protein
MGLEPIYNWGGTTFLEDCHFGSNSTIFRHIHCWLKKNWVPPLTGLGQLKLFLSKGWGLSIVVLAGF